MYTKSLIQFPKLLLFVATKFVYVLEICLKNSRSSKGSQFTTLMEEISYLGYYPPALAAVPLWKTRDEGSLRKYSRRALYLVYTTREHFASHLPRGIFVMFVEKGSISLRGHERAFFCLRLGLSFFVPPLPMDRNLAFANSDTLGVAEPYLLQLWQGKQYGNKLFPYNTYYGISAVLVIYY